MSQSSASREARFAFGKNWKDYQRTMTEADRASSRQDIVDWLGDGVAGKRVLDLGSGSGIHSLALHELGARELLSFDYDQDSVEATQALWERAGRPASWTVEQGSALDEAYLAGLAKRGLFDVVYSWGVLHHTGQMWRAVENALGLVVPGGVALISLYQKGPSYEKHLARKLRYHHGGTFTKRCMELWNHILPIMGWRLIMERKNPFAWNQRCVRGMCTYHDIKDWLGGLPYEVADQTEVEALAGRLGFVLRRANVAGEGVCSVYLLERVMLQS